MKALAGRTFVASVTDSTHLTLSKNAVVTKTGNGTLYVDNSTARSADDIVTNNTSTTVSAQFRNLSIP